MSEEQPQTSTKAEPGTLSVRVQLQDGIASMRMAFDHFFIMKFVFKRCGHFSSKTAEEEGGGCLFMGPGLQPDRCSFVDARLKQATLELNSELKLPRMMPVWCNVFWSFFLDLRF